MMARSKITRLQASKEISLLQNENTKLKIKMERQSHVRKKTLELLKSKALTGAKRKQPLQK